MQRDREAILRPGKLDWLNRLIFDKTNGGEKKKGFLWFFIKVYMNRGTIKWFFFFLIMAILIPLWTGNWEIFGYTSSLLPPLTLTNIIDSRRKNCKYFQVIFFKKDLCVLTKVLQQYQLLGLRISDEINDSLSIQIYKKYNGVQQNFQSNFY